jgi:hypothetical protein
MFDVDEDVVVVVGGGLFLEESFRRNFFAC